MAEGPKITQVVAEQSAADVADAVIDTDAPPAANGETAAVIECVGLSKVYDDAGHQVSVLEGVNLAVAPGEKIAVIGVSGSGKSTLLNMLGGLDQPSAGQVRVCGRSFGDMSDSQAAAWRNRHLGFVYQFHHLLGEFSALENVAMPLLIAGKTRREALDRARVLLTDVGLAERLDHKPAALSGGERQRVAIARALAGGPSCVLMDEPTGNLDPETANSVLGLLLRLNKELRTSIVVVTHDQDIARKMDRVVGLQKGHLRQIDI